jgi:hypothetical protein
MWALAFGHHEDRTPTHGYAPTREAAMIALHNAAALRDFNPAYVRFGSFATNQYAALSGRMSASPPIATELMQRREPTRCANSRHMQCSKMGCPYSITSSARC